MAGGSVEQILQNEYRKLTLGSDPSKSIGLMNSVKASAPPDPTRSETKTATKTPTLAAVSPVNKGYTLPTQLVSQPNATSGGSVAGAIGSTALKFFTSGLGVMPLVSGLAGLFGGGGSPAPEPLVKYAMPQSLQVRAANSHGGGPLSLADYNQDGTVRAFGANPGGSGSSAAQSSSNTSAGQIVVNVQAMDSRSFLDHSQEIAQAVREAMLNMHALNDVVNEL